MRVIVNGLSGIDKKEYLERVVRIARRNGINVELFTLGDMMYEMRGNIKPGRILKLPPPELNELRRFVCGEVLRSESENIIVNTHACFRWEQSLFPGFDSAFINKFSPNMYVTVIDDIDAIKARLNRIPYWRGRYTLKDLMTWRDEEVFTSELMATNSSKPHYVVARGHPPETLFKLIFKQNMRKVYVSHPITSILDQPKTLREIKRFKARLENMFVVFDPLTIKERDLIHRRTEASKKGKRTFIKKVLGRRVKFHVSEVKMIENHIDGQIIARDYKMIDQSDMLIAYIPQFGKTGKPVPSSGVDSEINYAFGRAKDVYLISPVNLGPFIMHGAREHFKSPDELIKFFRPSSR